MKTYLNAGERNKLRALFLGKMTFDAKGNTGGEMSGAVLDEAEKMYIELAVVSFDGSAESIYERLNELMPEDYDFVIKEANAVGAGNFSQAK